jgi:pyruvate dehydrogenase (quinone)
LPDFPYARYAESLGLRGIRMSRPDEVADGWKAAFAADRPVVVEAIVDPNVATLPPFITFEQAKSFATALVKGDPDEVPAVVQSVKGMLATVFPQHNE